MTEPWFQVIKPAAIEPLLVHIPHASKYIPSELRKSFVLTSEELDQELVRMTDAYTDELFSAGPTHCVTMINRLSRLVMDPERFCDDDEEVMASKGMGAIYTKTSFGTDLKHKIDEAEKSTLIDQFYRPYHARLVKEASQMLEQFKLCLVVDGHSFPSKPLPYELNQSTNRPDICIGTDAFHTPWALQDFCVSFWRGAGYTVGVNEPFSGSLVPLQYYQKDQRVQSIMIEIRRGLYMNEANGEKNSDFSQMNKVTAEFLEDLSMNYLAALIPGKRRAAH